MLDPLSYLRFALALGVVLALIAGLAWIVRRTALGRAVTGRHGRLGVVDSASLDARRRLVLVRRDGVEHLLLLAPGSEVVIESGITPPTKRATPPGAVLTAEET